MGQIRDAGGWVQRQVGGLFDNLRSFVGRFGLQDILPPSVISVIEFIANQIPYALGYTSSPARHFAAVIAVSVAGALASFGFLTVFAVFFAIAYGGLALLRFIPAVGKRWPADESDWPFWEV